MNGFECACTAGYTGFICDANINDCSPDPCGNGSCTVRNYNNNNIV